MRVGIDVRPLRRELSGGVVQFIEDLCPALFIAGRNVSFFVYHEDGGFRLGDSLPGNVQQVSLPDCDPAWLDLALARDRVDVLFRAFPFDDALVFPPSRRLVLLPDLQHEDCPDFFASDELERRRRGFGRAIDRSGAIALLSRHAEQRLRAHFPSLSAKVVHLPPGPPALEALLAAPLAAEERALMPDEPFFLFPANLWVHKNHRRLLLAFERFLSSRADRYSLVLTGATVGNEDLISGSTGLPVHHLGLVSRRLLAELYRRCVAVVFFSLYEGFGLPALEAFQLGAPVLCSNTTSLVEVVGDAALTCDPEDVEAMATLMHRVVESAELRTSMVARGRLRLDAYDWRRSAEAALATVLDLERTPPRHDEVVEALHRFGEMRATQERERRAAEAGLDALRRDVDELKAALEQRTAWAEQSLRSAEERLEIMRSLEATVHELRAALDEANSRSAAIGVASDAHDTLVSGGDELLVSVIMPLPDSRGHAIESVQAWAQRQRFRRDRYEVILISDGTDPALEAQAASMLQPHDRLLIGPAGSEYRLYEIGARAAQGRWLVFTESHCAADPDCLAELVRYLARSGLDGAACHSIGTGTGYLARMETRAYEQVSSIRLDPTHFSKVFLRGTAVSREAFRAVGGLQWRYSLFCEPLLAASLHAAGFRLGYAPAARVNHFNTTTYAELRESVQNYVGGECRYRLDHPSGERDRYFGTPAWWTDRSRLDVRLARQIWRSLTSSLLEPGPARSGRWRRWLALTPITVLGARWYTAQTDLRVGLSRIRCWWWRRDEERLLPAYHDLWTALTERAALRTLAEAASAVDQGCTPRDRFGVADVPEAWLSGFHLVEAVDGARFRWSGPVAGVKLPLAPGDRQLRLITRGLRHRPRLRAFFNGHRLAIHDCQAEHGEIRLAISARHLRPGPFQYLVLLTQPLRPWLEGVPDRRELGIPLFEIVRAGACEHEAGQRGPHEIDASSQALDPAP